MLKIEKYDRKIRRELTCSFKAYLQGVDALHLRLDAGSRPRDCRASTPYNALHYGVDAVNVHVYSNGVGYTYSVMLPACSPHYARMQPAYDGMQAAATCNHLNTVVMQPACNLHYALVWPQLNTRTTPS